MTTMQQDSSLTQQIAEDTLIFNTVYPGAQVPTWVAQTQAGLLFAEYALTEGSDLFWDMPHAAVPASAYYPGGVAASAGNEPAFITTAFENALGRAPTSTDIAYYEHMISDNSGAFFGGYEYVLLGISMSPESQAHNHIHA